MTEELFDKAVAEGNPVCYYLFKDLGIDKGCKYFVETGTFEGYSVQVALDHGYEEVFSCELFPERYGKCLERFEDNDNVNLWLGDSDDAFSEMMSKVDKKSCFWLDAHGEGGGQAGSGRRGGDQNDAAQSGTAGSPNNGSGGDAGANGFGIVFSSTSVENNCTGSKNTAAAYGGDTVGSVL